MIFNIYSEVIMVTMQPQQQTLGRRSSRLHWHFRTTLDIMLLPRQRGNWGCTTGADTGLLLWKYFSFFSKWRLELPDSRRYCLGVICFMVQKFVYWAFVLIMIWKSVLLWNEWQVWLDFFIIIWTSWRGQKCPSHRSMEKHRVISCKINNLISGLK